MLLYVKWHWIKRTCKRPYKLMWLFDAYHSTIRFKGRNWSWHSTTVRICAFLSSIDVWEDLCLPTRFESTMQGHVVTEVGRSGEINQDYFWHKFIIFWKQVWNLENKDFAPKNLASAVIGTILRSFLTFLNALT